MTQLHTACVTIMLNRNSNFNPHTHAGFTGSPDIRWGIWTGCWHRMRHPDRQRPSYTLQVSLIMLNRNSNFNPHTHAGFTGSPDIRWGIWTGCWRRMGHPDRQWPSYTLQVSLIMLNRNSNFNPHTHAGFTGSPDIRWGIWTGCWHRMGHPDRQRPSYTLQVPLIMLNRNSNFNPHTHAGFTGSPDIRWGIWTDCWHRMRHPDRQRPSYTLQVSLIMLNRNSNFNPHTHAGFTGSPDIRWGIWTGCWRRMGHPDRQRPSYTLQVSLIMLNRNSNFNPHTHAGFTGSPDIRWGIWTGCWRRMRHPDRQRPSYTLQVSLIMLNRNSNFNPHTHAGFTGSPDIRWGIWTGCWRRMRHPDRQRPSYTLQVSLIMLNRNSNFNPHTHAGFTGSPDIRWGIWTGCWRRMGHPDR